MMHNYYQPNTTNTDLNDCLPQGNGALNQVYSVGCTGGSGGIGVN